MLLIQILLSFLVVQGVISYFYNPKEYIPLNIKDRMNHLLDTEIKLLELSARKNGYSCTLNYIEERGINHIKDNLYSKIIEQLPELYSLKNFSDIKVKLLDSITTELLKSIEKTSESFYETKYKKLKNSFNKMKEHLTTKINSYEASIRELQAKNKELLEQNKLVKITSYDETVRILDDMFNKFINDIFYFEIERTWAITNPDKPTENHYRLPSEETRKNHKVKIYSLMKTAFSQDYLNRLELYFSPFYIDEYLKDKINSLYDAKFIKAANESAALSKIVRSNLEELKIKNTEKEKQKTINNNKRLNEIVSAFGHKPILPETEEELKTKPAGGRTYQFLKNKYILNSMKYDELRKTINNENDIYRDMEKYEFGDDRMLALVADELKWTEEILNPEKIEKAKISLVDMAFKQPPGRKFNPFDLMDERYKTYPAEKTEWGGVLHDLKDKRLNSALYDKRLYSDESPYKNIQEALEAKGAISITM